MSHSEDELRRFGEWERVSWEQRAGAYAASLGDLTRGSIPALLRAAGVGHGTRLLDVGTGPGFVASAAVELGAEVTAVDQSAAMVRIARSVGVRSLQATVESLPFPRGAFDAVVAGYLLNHLPRPEAALAGLARVLAAGGRLAMTVWDVPADNPAIGLFGPVVAELGLSAVVPPGPDSQRFADEAEVHRLLAHWEGVCVERLRWRVRVAPGAWFDALADATPKTGAVLAQAGPQLRASARERYVHLTAAQYGEDDGLVALPAGAVLVSATNAATAHT